MTLKQIAWLTLFAAVWAAVLAGIAGIAGPLGLILFAVWFFCF
jgi:hypothetical protein